MLHLLYTITEAMLPQGTIFVNHALFLAFGVTATSFETVVVNVVVNCVVLLLGSFLWSGVWKVVF